LSDAFIFDSNFYISLAQTKYPMALDKVLDLTAGKGWVMHVTEPILDEVKYVRSKGSKHTAMQLSKAMMDVHPADDKGIVNIRTQLGGGHRAPQAPDLSLMVLAAELSKGGRSVKLISDDYKISTSSKEMGQSYAVLSPSVFLFTLSRELRGDDKKLVRMLYKKVRHGEMEYVLSRADVYNVEDKLTWLMDNLLTTVTDPEGQPSHAATEVTLLTPGKVPGQTVNGGDWDALIRHLRGEHVRRGHIKSFDPIMPHLEPLTDLLDVLRDIHRISDGGDIQGALRQSHSELSTLKSQLQLSVGALDYEMGRKVLRAYAEMLPHLEMVTALLHINLGEVMDCEDHLDNVALLALAAGLNHIVVEANYLESLVHAYRDAWEDAEEQFSLTFRLAEQAGDEATVLRSLIGGAVASQLNGDREGAEEKMSQVNERVEADPWSGSVALEEFGDHFTNFGATYLAVGLYTEALECAVESQAPDDAVRILGKLRRARLSMGLEERETAAEIKDLIDMANDIQDKELLDTYLAMEDELASEMESMDDLLEGTFDEWSPATRLPDPLEDWLDIVRADPLPKGEGTILVCYSSQMGNVGVLVNDSVSLPGIELARFRVTSTSKVKLVEAPEPFRSGYRLRGIIVLHEEAPYLLSRSPIRLRRQTRLVPEPAARQSG